MLAFDTCVFDHGAGIGLQAGHGAADVSVDFYYFFDGGGFEEGGGYTLFDAEEDAMGCCYLNQPTRKQLPYLGGGV